MTSRSKNFESVREDEKDLRKRVEVLLRDESQDLILIAWPKDSNAVDDEGRLPVVVCATAQDDMHIVSMVFDFMKQAIYRIDSIKKASMLCDMIGYLALAQIENWRDIRGEALQAQSEPVDSPDLAQGESGDRHE